MQTDRCLRAIDFARERHAGQTYNDRPYTFHLYTVVSGLVNPTEDQVIAAYLHDILEDTDTTSLEITLLFGIKVTRMVRALTRKKGEKYFDYIERIKRGPDEIRAIKLADLHCNLRYAPTDSLHKRYQRAIAILEKD